MIWFIVIGAVFFLGGLSQIFSNFGNGLVMVVIGAALLFWAFRKKILPGVFDSRNGAVGSSGKTEDFLLAGTSYYADNIGKLACCNPAWKYTAAKAATEGLIDRPIYRYNYINKPVKLIPEPKNPNDKNAVAVFIAGELVGYLKKDDNRHVLDILKMHSIEYVSGFIGGGDYKIISADGNIAKDSAHFSIRITIGYK